MHSTIRQCNWLSNFYSIDNPIEIYDLRKQELVESFKWDTEEGGKGCQLLGCTYSKPNYDTVIACGSQANELKCFNVKSKETTASVTGVKKPIY